MATTSKQTHSTTTTKALPGKATARAAKGTASSSKPMRSTTKPGKAAPPEPSLSAAAAPVPAPEFLTLGYWLLGKQISVRALAGAINKHGVVTFDDLDMPQHHPVGSSQAERRSMYCVHAMRSAKTPSRPTTRALSRTTTIGPATGTAG